MVKVTSAVWMKTPSYFVNGIFYTAVTQPATVIVKLFVVSSKTLMTNAFLPSTINALQLRLFNGLLHTPGRIKEKHD